MAAVHLLILLAGRPLLLPMEASLLELVGLLVSCLLQPPGVPALCLQLPLWAPLGLHFPISLCGAWFDHLCPHSVYEVLGLPGASRSPNLLLFLRKWLLPLGRRG